jgi:hypothetical protein
VPNLPRFVQLGGKHISNQPPLDINLKHANPGFLLNLRPRFHQVGFCSAFLEH